MVFVCAQFAVTIGPPKDSIKVVALPVSSIALSVGNLIAALLKCDEWVRKYLKLSTCSPAGRRSVALAREAVASEVDSPNSPYSTKSCSGSGGCSRSPTTLPLALRDALQ